MSLWKTTVALLIGLTAQGCGFMQDFYRNRFEQQAEAHLMRVAERMSYNEELRRAAYEEPFPGEEFDYEHTAKRTMKKAGRGLLKAGWSALTKDTSLDGMIEPSFKDEEGNILPSIAEPGMQEEPKRHSRYRLGFMPVVRVGNEVGGGLKIRNASVLALKGDDYWEYRATANLLHFRIAAEYLDHDVERDRLKFGIGRGPLSFSFSEGPDGEKEYWIEFFK